MVGLHGIVVAEARTHGNGAMGIILFDLGQGPVVLQNMSVAQHLVATLRLGVYGLRGVPHPTLQRRHLRACQIHVQHQPRRQGLVGCEFGVIVIMHVDGHAIGALRLEAWVVLVAEACA